ncbi:unnamed protein product [Plutella xylostella]|uniref:(diamondback moth) hypothetical protein n=1 Tax=Plutella xylostella TaxID=51655 RepID=A0A8S4GCE1_PLUXY|nr:unnamed protein product [Plutella xylostella]
MCRNFPNAAHPSWILRATSLSKLDLPNRITCPRAKIIPVPNRSRRLLWDQFHSLRYPGGYFPRDDLRAKHDPLDWRADHPHTNHREMYRRLRDHQYYVEVAGTALTCIDMSLYGALLLVDPEDEYFPEELAALKKAVDEGLSLVVFADWYNATLLKHVKFYDENTRQWWIPETGGANIPALNDLLGMFQIALGDRVFSGPFRLPPHAMFYASGTHVHTFPSHGLLVTAQLHDQARQIMSGEKAGAEGEGDTMAVPVLGLLQTGADYANDTDAVPKAGRIVVYGDSSCLEGGASKPCHWLLLSALQYAIAGHVPQALRDMATPHKDNHIIPSELPQRAPGGRLELYSRVLARDGSGPRPPPPCPAPPPLPPRPVPAPPRRTFVPRPPPQDHGILETDSTERARRAWRGAGAPPRASSAAGYEATSWRLLLLLAAAASLYVATALWNSPAPRPLRGHQLAPAAAARGRRLALRGHCAVEQVRSPPAQAPGSVAEHLAQG